MRQYDQPDNSQPSPQQAYTWFDAVILLLKSPDIATFSLILKDCNMSPQRAYFQVLLGGILPGVALAAAYSPLQVRNAMLIGLPGTVEASGIPADLPVMALSGTMLGAVFGLIGFIMMTVLFHQIGKFMNLKVPYRDLAVLRGIFYPVILTIRAIMIAIPGLEPLTLNILLIATLVLDVGLSAVAMRAAANRANEA